MSKMTKSGYVLIDCATGCGRALAVPKIEFDKLHGWTCPCCEDEAMAEYLIAQTEAKLTQLRSPTPHEKQRYLPK